MSDQTQLEPYGGHRAPVPHEGPIDDPGLPEHEPRPTDVDPVMEKRAERQVAGMFMLASVLTILFVVAYFAFEAGPDGETFMGWGASNLFLGLTLGLALLLIGAGLIQWARKLMGDHEIIEYRHGASSSAEDREEVLAQFYLCQAAVPHMQPGAVIINTTSVQAYEPSAELIHYAVSKGAIRTFTQALAKQLIEKGIRVNGVAPGPVWTPLIAMSFEADEVSEFGKNSPMGRPAQPAELAPAYVFLASDESRYVVGDIVGVTGGTPLA